MPHMKSSTRVIAIASLASFFTGLSLSAMAGDPPKHPQSTKPVQKVDTTSKIGSKESSFHAPRDGQPLSPDVGTAIDIVHGILGR
jgi:hypothetical protein